MIEPSNSFTRLEELEFQCGGSSKGVLAKCFTENLNGCYLLKTGSFTKPIFSNLEPVTECVCSDLADLFKINHAHYSLEMCFCKESDLWKYQKVLVCKTKLFTDKDKILISGEKLIGNYRDYSSIIRTLGESMRMDFNNMIVFDYLVNNTDRHHNNFGVLVNPKERTKILAPLFDHGFSLLSDFDSDYLVSEDFDVIYDDCDYSKLCGKSNYLQLKNVDSFSLNLEVNEDVVFSILSKYQDLIPKWRIDLMVRLLNRRLSYVRKSFIKVDKCYVRRNN